MKIRFPGSKRDAAPETPAAGLAVSGDLRVNGNASFPLGLSTQGDLTLEPDALLEGDVRVGGTLRLGTGARITGSATVAGEVIAAADASIGGALACKKLLLRAGKAPLKQAVTEAEVVAARPA